MSVRLDMWLVQNGVFGGRDTAKKHIEAGEISVNGKTVTKASFGVEAGDTVTCTGSERYVGRGGYKLEKALAACLLSLDGVTALDVGASTGGFTDCMLQYGAKKVYAVDVGHGQLHPSLRENPAVICLEGTDIRSKDAAAQITDCPAFCSVDVSFISLKQVLPAVLQLVAADAVLVCLIKPQFEAGRAALGKNGVVKDKTAHVAVLCELCRFFDECGCGLVKLMPSPIRGGEGNIEYLAVLRRGAAGAAADVRQLVNEAFSTL